VFRKEVSFELVAIVHARVCNHAGANFLLHLVETRKTSAFKSNQVYARTLIHRPGLLSARAGCCDDRLRTHQSALAGWSLLSGSSRRNVFESGGIEHSN